jgi:hypothetical protein
MLHIATVHFKSFRWIPIQARELKRNISVPYMTWGSLEGIDPAYGAYFDHVFDQTGSHADKLNGLAVEIAAEAAEGDLLMFLDGDAFPIADPGPLIASGLASAPLLAVQRAECCGKQPHPCFCVTDVATWQGLPGDWGRGPSWIGLRNELVTDVGGNLLSQLELTNTPWTRVLRSNRYNLHPLLFGIYGDTLYHHGAGFRDPRTRIDMVHLKYLGFGAGEGSEARKIIERNRELSEAVFQRIQRDIPSWWEEFA